MCTVSRCCCVTVVTTDCLASQSFEKYGFADRVPTNQLFSAVFTDKFRCIFCVGIGVPLLLAYVYGVVPISLCRSGGCGVSTTDTGGVRIDFDESDVHVETAVSPFAGKFFCRFTCTCDFLVTHSVEVAYSVECQIAMVTQRFSRALSSVTWVRPVTRLADLSGRRSFRSAAYT